MRLPVALCPHPPLLLRELTGREDVAAELRAACLDAVARLLATGPREVVVLGGHDSGGPVDPGLPLDVRSFGTTHPRVAGPALPLSLGVGRRLLDESGWSGPTTMTALAWDAEAGALDPLAEELAGRSGVAVLLLGDGSARRGEKAPGFLDERAFGFDDAIAQALARGDAPALRDLDARLARELMVGGRSVLRLLGRLGERRGLAEAALLHRSDPFGVSYLVASWELV